MMPLDLCIAHTELSTEVLLRTHNLAGEVSFGVSFGMFPWCVPFLSLHNKLSQIWWLKTAQIHHLTVFVGQKLMWCGWILCSGFHQAKNMMARSTVLIWAPRPAGCQQNPFSCCCRTGPGFSSGRLGPTLSS